jgi:hypothetical protein
MELYTRCGEQLNKHIELNEPKKHIGAEGDTRVAISGLELIAYGLYLQ